jgi:hypothetical protein
MFSYHLYEKEFSCLHHAYSQIKNKDKTIEDKMSKIKRIIDLCQQQQQKHKEIANEILEIKNGDEKDLKDYLLYLRRIQYTANQSLLHVPIKILTQIIDQCPIKNEKK